MRTVPAFHTARRNEWSALSLLRPVSPDAIAWDTEQRAVGEPILWDSAATEYAAQNLYRHLRARGLPRTRELERFLSA